MTMSISTIKISAAGRLADYYDNKLAADYYETKEQNRLKDWRNEATTSEQLNRVLRNQDMDTGRPLLDPQPASLRKLAAEIGTEGELTAADMEQLRQGINPLTGDSLTATQQDIWDRGVKSHNQVSAIDMPLSVSKSFSLFLVSLPEEEREALIAKIEQAAKNVMTFAEDEGLMSVRRGEGGATTMKAHKLQYVSKTEFTARAVDGKEADPQFHIHQLVSNAAMGEDGRITTLNASLLFHASKVLGTRFQAEVAQIVEQEFPGVKTVLGGNGTREIAGIPQELIDQYSKRSNDIADKLEDLERRNKILTDRVEANLEAHREAFDAHQAGEELTAEQKRLVEQYSEYQQILHAYKDPNHQSHLRQKAALESRIAKGEESEAEAFARWRQDPNLNSERLLEQAQAAAKHLSDQPTREQFIEGVIANISARQANFREKDVMTEVISTLPTSFDLSEIRALAQEVMEHEQVKALEQNQDLQVGEWVLRNKGQRLTSDAVLAKEAAIQQAAFNLGRADGVKLTFHEMQALVKDRGLTAEQEEMLVHCLATGQNLSIVNALAGGGKTFTGERIVQGLQDKGYTVVGLSTSAKAADALKEAGVNATASNARFLMGIENGFVDTGLTPEQVKQSRVLREAMENAKRSGSPAEVAKAQEDFVRWSKGVDRETASLKREGEQIAKLWQQFKEAKATGSDFKYSAEELIERTNDYKATKQVVNLEQTDEKFALFVDEAAMMNNEDLEAILTTADQNGWKVVMVGDDKQQDGIGVSTGFRLAENAVGSVSLQESYRAKDKQEKGLQEDWHKSDLTPEGLEVAEYYLAYQEQRGHAEFFGQDEVQEFANINPTEEVSNNTPKKLAVSKIADEYMQALQEGKNPHDLLVMAARNADARMLGEEIKQRMIEAGMLDPETAQKVVIGQNTRGQKVVGEVLVGQQIRITENSNRKHGSVDQYQNGWICDVVEWKDDGTLLVKTAEGKHINIPKKHLDRGCIAYGTSSIAAAQGRTVDQAWALVSDGQTREDIYPALTRGKHQNKMMFVQQPDQTRPEARESFKRSMLTSGKEQPALLQMENSLSPRQEREIREGLESRGLEATPEAVKAYGDRYLQKVYAQKIRNRTEIRSVATEKREAYQARKEAEKQQKQTRGRGMAA